MADQLIRLDSYPFDSKWDGYDAEGYPVFDRAVGASLLKATNKLFFTNGLFPRPATNLQMTAGEGYNLHIAQGWGIIEGAIGGIEAEEGYNFKLLDEAPRGNKVFSVFLRFDDNDEFRSLYIRIAEGTEIEEPEIAPSVYELRLGYVSIPSNAESMTEATITDERGLSVCPYAAPFEEIDISEVIAEVKRQAGTQYAAFVDYLEANMSFINSAIDGTAAGALQAAINELRQDALTKDMLDGETLKLSGDNVVSVDAEALAGDGIEVEGNKLKVSGLKFDSVDDLAKAVRVKNNRLSDVAVSGMANAVLYMGNWVFDQVDPYKLCKGGTDKTIIANMANTSLIALGDGGYSAKFYGSFYVYDIISWTRTEYQLDDLLIPLPAAPTSTPILTAFQWYDEKENAVYILGVFGGIINTTEIMYLAEYVIDCETMTQTSNVWQANASGYHQLRQLASTPPAFQYNHALILENGCVCIPLLAYVGRGKENGGFLFVVRNKDGNYSIPFVSFNNSVLNGNFQVNAAPFYIIKDNRFAIITYGSADYNAGQGIAYDNMVVTSSFVVSDAGEVSTNNYYSSAGDRYSKTTTYGAKYSRISQVVTALSETQGLKTYGVFKNIAVSGLSDKSYHYFKFTSNGFVSITETGNEGNVDLHTNYRDKSPVFILSSKNKGLIYYLGQRVIDCETSRVLLNGGGTGASNYLYDAPILAFPDNINSLNGGIYVSRPFVFGENVYVVAYVKDTTGAQKVITLSNIGQEIGELLNA